MNVVDSRTRYHGVAGRNNQSINQSIAVYNIPLLEIWTRFVFFPFRKNCYHDHLDKP